MRRLVLAATLALGGCTTGPDYRPPELAAGASRNFIGAPGAATPLPDAWWTLYDDPVLDRLVAAAFAANTDLRAAEANLDAARAALAGTRAARLPMTSESAGTSYGRTSTQTQIAGALGREAKTDWTDAFGGDVAYEVDLFGRIRRSVEAARADADAAAAERDAVRVLVASETIRAYVSACAAAYQVDVANRSADVALEQQAIVSRGFAAGGAARFDAVRTTTLLAQTRAAIPPLEGERRAALFALAAMLGRTPDAAPREAEVCRKPPELRQALPVGDGAALLRRRPDVRLAERRLAAASARIGVAEADLLPRISLLGSVSTAAPAGVSLGTRASTSFGIGPFVSWSFPNFGAARARLQAARAEDRAAVARFDGAVVTALKEVEQALARYAAALDRARELDAAEASARQALDLARGRRDAGAASQLDLLLSEQTLIEAQAAVAQSRAQRTDLLVTVFKALGGGWQR
ncbi:efflux transporter outer membrane subunit [Sphingomonas sp. NFR15]|uniref:efflux transporter outer membrane subunit n=1 Tax=Sphingomonas sp. NFR15 TaxID=1566282 RepID=UPI00088246A7|nr:efflux transporter outer membrane subunit [Sphingomonas sp. NFR15]SDA36376.1 efflux transporter, outer membrane factor (OMF) lipoprotein, NodT family [Sphingomonas sp. NFR15]